MRKAILTVTAAALALTGCASTGGSLFNFGARTPTEAAAYMAEAAAQEAYLLRSE